MKFKKKTDNNYSIELQPNQVSFTDNILKICPRSFNKDECYFNYGKYNKKKLKTLIIENNCKILKQYGRYYISIPYTLPDIAFKDNQDSYCGIDPGVRDFMTVFGNDGFSTYKMDNTKFKENNRDIYFMKKVKRIRKKSFFKRERKKDNVITQVHYDTINDLLSRYNTIFYGDIKSHSIVKKSKNSRLNLDFSDIKFYQFKQRLIHKAEELGKRIFFINESYTSKTCSNCGFVDKKLGQKKTYSCKLCDQVMDRDLNAAKNMLMKGLESLKTV